MASIAYTFTESEDRRQKINFLKDQHGPEQISNLGPFTCQMNALLLNYYPLHIEHDNKRLANHSMHRAQQLYMRNFQASVDLIYSTLLLYMVP